MPLRSFGSVVSLSSAARDDARAEEAPAKAALQPLNVYALYRQSAPLIRSMLSRIAGLTADPDDLLQEVFLIALRRSEVLQSQDFPERWLYRVAINVALSHRRRTKLRQFLHLDAFQDVASDWTPVIVLEKKEARSQVLQILEKISDRKRMVFVLFELEGLSGEEIAEVVGCPLKTVWTRLHYARRDFLKQLGRAQRAEKKSS